MRKLGAFVAAIVGAAFLSVASCHSTPQRRTANAAVRPAGRSRRPRARSPARLDPPQLTAQDVNAWLDGFMPYALGRATSPAPWSPW